MCIVLSVRLQSDANCWWWPYSIVSTQCEFAVLKRDISFMKIIELMTNILIIKIQRFSMKIIHIHFTIMLTNVLHCLSAYWRLIHLSISTLPSHIYSTILSFAKVTCNTHKNKKLLSIPLKLVPSLAKLPLPYSPLPLGGASPHTQN